MTSLTQHLPRNQQAVVDRFVSVCQGDERVVAAILGGSHAEGTADAYSDLDLRLITADGAYEDFLADKEAFVRLLGEPLFLEDFDCPHAVFFILANGAECELAIGRESRFHQVQQGAYRTLVDKTAILARAVFPRLVVDRAEQRETLRRLIAWFWHDLSHVTAALGRGQLWWAHGQIEILRRVCVNLARLRQDFGAAADSYDKVDEALPSGQLAPLEPAICPLDTVAMLQAVDVIVQLYRELARPLAREHGVPYPETLDRLMSARLESVRPAAG